MEHDFWQQRWRNNEIGFHQQTINPWLAYYYGEKGPPLDKRTSLRVFVPLCGKSRDMLWLLQNGYRVVGNELCDIAVRDFFSESKLQHKVEYASQHTHYQGGGIDILQGDFFALDAEQLGQVSDVFDRAALIALPPEMRKQYAEKMTELLSSGTRMLLVTMTYPQHEIDGPPFSVDEDEVQVLYAKQFRIDKLAARDTLAEEPRFQQRGLTALSETAYKLTRL